MKYRFYKGDAVKATRSKVLIEILMSDGWTPEELVSYVEQSALVGDLGQKRRGRPPKNRG